MKWYPHLFMGERARKERYRIVAKIKLHKIQADVYVLTLASNPENLLDIYPSNILLQPYFRRQAFLIVGIARGYEEALELAAHILSQIYRDTGGFEVREYLKVNP